MIFGAIFGSIIIAYIVFHAFAYFSIVHFFGIASPYVKRTISAFFILLALSFFIAVFLSHAYNNVFTQNFYFVSGVWIGFLINIALIFASAWIAIAIFPWMGTVSHKKIIGAAIVFFAVVYSAYGVWNAFNPAIKHLEVALSNLPKEWVGKKIVQISDVHLGHVYGQKYLEDVVQKINALKPDMIMITGDLFDGTDGNIDVFSESLGKLNSPKGIYYAIGNHETYLGIEKVKNVIKKTKITLLRDEMRITDGIQIIGVDYPERMESKDLGVAIKKIPGFDSKKTSILLWHAPTQTENAKKSGISLQLSGHTHKGQLFPFGFITQLVFGGYDYGYKNEGAYSIYTSSGLGGWGPPMRTEKRSEIVEITLR